MLIALGGGVGDLTGFSAAIALRGSTSYRRPTLLAQVDSSVGGKTAIDMPRQEPVGAFHQPKLVLADVALDTLPRRDLLAGYAETVKYGLIDDAEFLDGLKGMVALIDGDMQRAATPS